MSQVNLFLYPAVTIIFQGEFSATTQDLYFSNSSLNHLATSTTADLFFIRIATSLNAGYAGNN